ncbi:hypothetical protein OG242_26705 [Streptomyces sp. NBC_00727]
MAGGRAGGLRGEEGQGGTGRVVGGAAALLVHDGESGPWARDQGGTLDLDQDNGQTALREAGLLDDFHRLSRPEGQEMRQLDTTGTILFHHVPGAGELFKPEIDRGTLRRLLLDSLEPGTVRWGRTLRSVEGPAGGPRRLRFADGTVVEADLVIGADGARSAVRRALSEATPEYSGISFLEAWFHNVDNDHPAVAELVGRGSAVLDGCELALALARHDTVGEAVRACEGTMLPRSGKMQRLLDHGAEELVSDELPDFAQEGMAAR